MQMRASTTHYTGSNNDPHNSNTVNTHQSNQTDGFEAREATPFYRERDVLETYSSETKPMYKDVAFALNLSVPRLLPQSNDAIPLLYFIKPVHPEENRRRSRSYEQCIQPLLWLPFPLSVLSFLHAVAKPLFEVPEFSGALRR